MDEAADKQPVAETVFQGLRSKILAGEYTPGEALPGERALSKSLGVNRGAVRESLKRLAEAGLVEIQHGEHTRVRDFRKTGTLELLSDLIVRSDGSVDFDVALSILNMILTARISAIRMAAEQSEELGPPLRAALEKLRNASGNRDPEAAMAARYVFWRTLFQDSGDPANRMLWNSLQKTGRPLMTILMQLPAPLGGEQTVLSRVVEVIGEGDPGAAERAVRELDKQFVFPLLESLKKMSERGDRLLLADCELSRD
jgi:DNA-binding FadR family transcriptional regulator